MSQQINVMRGIYSYPAYHLNLYTVDSNKNVRINSQTFTTAASICALQSKPRAGVNMSNDIVAIEVQPGINANYNSSGGIIGMKASPYFHANTGNIGSYVFCYEAQLCTDDEYAKTVTGPMACYRAKNDVHGTVTNGVFVNFIEAAGDNKAWTGFVYANVNGAGGFVVANDGMTDSPQTNAEAGYVTIKVGSGTYQMPFYNA
jgi:hypothetical protein